MKEEMLEYYTEQTKKLIKELPPYIVKIDSNKIQIMNKIGYNMAGKVYDKLIEEHYLIRDRKNLCSYIAGRNPTRKDYNSKDGFMYATSQQKEIGKCRGFNSPWNSRIVESCIHKEMCPLYDAYKKDTVREFEDYMNKIPKKWFGKCYLYRAKIDEGGEK